MSNTLIPIFAQATPDQRIACEKLAASAFRGPLSEDEYVEREEFMRSQGLAKNGGVRTWCLFSKDDPNLILATCVTFARTLLLTDRSGSRVATGFCIGSVISHPDHRGQGHASKLLHNVAEWLDGPGNAVASVLYSAKEAFYARVGWKPFPAPGVEMFASDSTLRTGSDLREHTRSIRASDINELYRKDVELLTDEILKVPNEEHPSVLTILPTNDLASYQHARAEFQGLKIRGRTPEIKGALHTSNSWISWYHDFKKGFLFIQRFRIFHKPNENAGETLATLLHCAILEAQHWKLDVMVWGIEPSLNDAVDSLRHTVPGLGSKRHTQRRETISVRWRYGEDQEHEIYPNEYYAWS
ncbi:hypothetical protein IQ07DRAFT_650361 [Pyrenochaeta sp. DS3sAY3a]|nr:hypothetical protein IQ07DRAFT_650361 [Pyrenochaeta sp. DS3sAY3a]